MNDIVRKRDEEAAREFWPTAVLTDGVIRWSTNDRCPFDDMLGRWQEMGLITAEVRAATNAARAADNEIAIAQYREAQARRTPAQIAAERAEMRAAFGPGETVVDVFTGERFRL